VPHHALIVTHTPVTHSAVASHAFRPPFHSQASPLPYRPYLAPPIVLTQFRILSRVSCSIKPRIVLFLFARAQPRADSSTRLELQVCFFSLFFHFTNISSRHCLSILVNTELSFVCDIGTGLRDILIVHSASVNLVQDTVVSRSFFVEENLRLEKVFALRVPPASAEDE
jgi:hypothetical protein